MMRLPSDSKCPECGGATEYWEGNHGPWDLVCKKGATCGWSRVAEEVTVVDMGIRIDNDAIDRDVRKKAVAEWGQVYRTAKRYQDCYLMLYAMNNIKQVRNLPRYRGGYSFPFLREQPRKDQDHE
jgi:hypothetical protein